MQIRVIFAAVAAVAILAGCAAGNDRLRNLNSQQIAEQIVDTQTNRQDVVALLGEPNTTLKVVQNRHDTQVKMTF